MTKEEFDVYYYREQHPRCRYCYYCNKNKVCTFHIKNIKFDLKAIFCSQYIPDTSKLDKELLT